MYSVDFFLAHHSTFINSILALLASNLSFVVPATCPIQLPGIHAATEGGAGMAAADQAALAGAKAAKEAKRYGFSKEAPDVRMAMRWKYGMEWVVLDGMLMGR